jgi:hypothetical protein
MVETQVTVFYTKWADLTQQQRKETLESIRSGVAGVLTHLQVDFTDQTKPSGSVNKDNSRHSEHNHRMSVIKAILVSLFASDENGNTDFLELGAFIVDAGVDMKREQKGC